MVTNLDDGDYFLKDGSGWFECHGLAVRIWGNDRLKCLEVSVYLAGQEDEDPITHATVVYEE